jgi:hypothetical protein
LNENQVQNAVVSPLTAQIIGVFRAVLDRVYRFVLHPE